MMPDTKVSVVIPVGPESHHQRWLKECLASVRAQTHSADEILLIDDMAGLVQMETYSADDPLRECRVWCSPWRLGVGIASNFGVALAKNDLVYILNSDDWMEPECLAACVEEYERRRDPLGYYYVTVRFVSEDGYKPSYIPDSLVMDLPGGSVLVTKQLWKHTGGFPMDAGGAAEPAFISILLGNSGAGTLYPVRQGTILHNIRVHPEQESAKRQGWLSVMSAARHLLTLEWKQPNWGRYE